jgi:disulfide bond formation protein DsbB
MIANILRALQQPEYVHVLINPLPVYGQACGLIALFIAICQRSRRATIVALAIVLLSTAAAWPVYIYGEKAYDGVLSMADADGQAWLAAHRARAENLIWLFYAVAALSAVALIAPIKWQRSSPPLAIAVLVLGVISLGAGGYIAYAGGKIRHREFRNEPPPKQSAGATQISSTGVASARVTIETLK